MLTYEEEGHKYSWNGFPIPSLSQLMNELGWGRQADLSQVNPQVLELARLRGEQVHEAIHRYLSGDPRFADSLSEASAPYFDSFLLAAEELPLSAGGIGELPVGGSCGYGTTPDRVEPEMLIEWKATSRIHPSVWIQLAAQEYAMKYGQPAPFDGMPNRPRAVVHLLKTGKKATIKIDKEPDLTYSLWSNSLLARGWKEKVKWK